MCPSCGASSKAISEEDYIMEEGSLCYTSVFDKAWELTVLSQPGP
jgi:hypothetical protein